MNNIIFIMTLSGSVILLLYSLLYPIIKHIVNIKCRYNILRLCIIFYLVPFPILKYILLSKILKKWNVLIPYSLQGSVYNLNKNFIIINENNKVLFSDSQILFIIFYIISITLLFLTIVYKIINFTKNKAKLIQYSQLANENEIKIMIELKKEMKLKRNIKLLKCEYSSLILNTGIFFPIILLPEKLNITTQELTNILRHELAHIKHNDIIWYFLSDIVIVIHWFNPISYLIKSSINIITELYSDEVVTLELDKVSKIDYCTTILNMLGEVSLKGNNKPSLNFLGKSESQIKERIDEIMNYKKRNKFISSIIGNSVFILAMTTVFYYQAPSLIYANEENTIFNQHSIDSDEFITSIELEEPIVIDDCFINKNNQIYEIINQSTYAICDHTYEEGTRKQHSTNQDGSCIVKYYNANRCVFCGEVRTGALYKTETYSKCPH